MAFLSYCHRTLYFLSGAIKLNQKLPLNNDNKITLFKIYWPHNKSPFIIYSPHLKLASQSSDKDTSQTLFSSVQSFLAQHWWQSSQERGNISAQGHSFVPGHKLRGEQVLTHGPNHLSLSLPHKKRWSRPAAFTAWQHGHGKLCFKKGHSSFHCHLCEQSAPGCKPEGSEQQREGGQPSCHVSHRSRLSR